MLVRGGVRGSGLQPPTAEVGGPGRGRARVGSSSTRQLRWHLPVPVLALRVSPPHIVCLAPECNRASGKPPRPVLPTPCNRSGPAKRPTANDSRMFYLFLLYTIAVKTMRLQGIRGCCRVYESLAYIGCADWDVNHTVPHSHARCSAGIGPRCASMTSYQRSTAGCCELAASHWVSKPCPRH